MITFNKTLSLTMAALLVSGNAFAQANKEDDKKLHNQASEYSARPIESIVTDDLIKSSLKNTQERDGHRGTEEMNILARNAIESEIKKVESQKQLAIEKFIYENVPASVLAAGSKSVAAYIQTNFVDKKSAGMNSPEDSIEVIWGGTDTALSMPEYTDGWDTTVKPVTTTTQVEASKPPATNNTENGLSDEERDMIKDLGLTEEELIIMMQGNDGTQAKANEKKTPLVTVEVEKDIETNVIISRINAERVVIMGDLSRADVEMEIQIIRGDKNRKTQKSFSNIKPGFLFDVDGVRFEFVSLNKNQIVFENLNTQRTFRSLLN